MKTIILTLVLIIPSLVKCQISSNIISESEFDSIKINAISLATIKNTLGEQNAVEALFGVANEKIIDPDGEFTHFEFNGFNIGFSAVISGGTFNSPILGGFKIYNNNYNITIQGKTVTIGDHKDKLGNVVINNQNNGGKSIVYQYCDGCNNFISIYLDADNIITKIIYIEQT